MSNKNDPKTVASLKRRIRELEEELAETIRFKERHRAEVERLTKAGKRNRQVYLAQLQQLGGQLAIALTETDLRQAKLDELKAEETQR